GRLRARAEARHAIRLLPLAGARPARPGAGPVAVADAAARPGLAAGARRAGEAPGGHQPRALPRRPRGADRGGGRFPRPDLRGDVGVLRPARHARRAARADRRRRPHGGRGTGLRREDRAARHGAARRHAGGAGARGGGEPAALGRAGPHPWRAPDEL
ncbi:MAG: BUG/TctC family periplasmic protein, partial [uncultured Acetobacteraceae bacterium]